jgi:DNA-binding SARP family transcriptional activator
VRGSCSPSHGRPRELFAYLLLHPRRIHHRENLSEILFPETEPQRARRHLCDVVYRLKACPGPRFMQTEGEYISIVESDLWVDVWEFNRTQHPIQGDRSL